MVDPVFLAWPAQPPFAVFCVSDGERCSVWDSDDCPADFYAEEVVFAAIDAAFEWGRDPLRIPPLGWVYSPFWLASLRSAGVH